MAITTILMRDVETGKLQRDAETGKLQRYVAYGGDCGWCGSGDTPVYVNLQISGLGDCLDCFPMGGEYWKAAGVAAAINGTNHALRQQYKPGEESLCVWKRECINGNYGTLTHYAGENCTGEETPYTLDKLIFRVEKCAASGLIISVQLVATAWGPTFLTAFAYAIPVWGCKAATITACIAVNALANQLVCNAGDYFELCTSGIVSVTEGPNPP